MPDSGYNLRLASGARRLTVHCYYCGGTLSCPPGEADLWVWVKRDDVKEFYRIHREHAGILADKLVGAEIEYDDGLLPKQEDDIPSLMNLLTPEGLQARGIK